MRSTILLLASVLALGAGAAANPDAANIVINGGAQHHEVVARRFGSRRAGVRGRAPQRGGGGNASAGGFGAGRQGGQGGQQAGKQGQQGGKAGGNQGASLLALRSLLLS